MYVKICGIKTEQDLNGAIACGASAVGIVLHPKSRRYVEPARAKQLAERVRGRIQTVCVGLQAWEVAEVCDAFDFVQLYEPAPFEKLILAGTNPPRPDHRPAMFLYDGTRGSGRFAGFPDWVDNLDVPVILAGGLDRENVGDVIRKHRPFGVDVSSGVERNGKKDPMMMRLFMEAVQHACSERILR